VTSDEADKPSTEYLCRRVSQLRAELARGLQVSSDGRVRLQDLRPKRVEDIVRHVVTVLTQLGQGLVAARYAVALRKCERADRQCRDLLDRLVLMESVTDGDWAALDVACEAVGKALERFERVERDVAAAFVEAES
jgi:hypothetical protein